MVDFRSQPTKTPKLRELKFDFNEYVKHLNGCIAIIRICSDSTHRISD
ncbi:hypothetical protein [cyanobacterium endosymbiont of Rhopalodia gibberula]|nr:hypothetical protein [cyanobacterium endosymbiont of Rhopalodia gibberula]